MRGPKPIPVDLTDEQRQALHIFIRRHSTPQQLALRARIILGAADGQSNTALAAAHQVTTDTVRIWRERWRLLQPIPLSELSLEERLRDAPRAGRTRGSRPNRSVPSWRWPARPRVSRGAPSPTGPSARSPTR